MLTHKKRNMLYDYAYANELYAAGVFTAIKKKIKGVIVKHTTFAGKPE